MHSKIIAVDFDGTLCENIWPEIGAPLQTVINYILDEQKNGAKLILWTNRNGELLDEAVGWCLEHGITFDAVNENLPEHIERFGNDSRKIFADEYIDDKAMPIGGIVLKTLLETAKPDKNKVKRYPSVFAWIIWALSIVYFVLSAIEFANYGIDLLTRHIVFGIVFDFVAISWLITGFVWRDDTYE